MTQSLEAGLFLSLTLKGLFIGSYERMRETAQEAERLGFHSVWLGDHFFTLDPEAYARQSGIAGRAEAGGRPPSRPLLEQWTALSALARDTKQIRLGTGMVCVSYRNPALLAKMAATLDVISGGRLELGLGAGWLESEYRAYGFPFPKTSVRIAQMEETVQIVKRMWTEPAASFEGAHFRIDGAICDPPPVQKPHPPIWIGGEGRKVLQVAARWADGFNARWWPPERLAGRQSELEAECRAAGRDPATLRPSLMLMLIPERDRAVAEAERRNYGAVPETGIIAGDPETCARRIASYVRAGVRRILFTIPNLEERPERLRLAGEEVLPAVRAELPE